MYEINSARTALCSRLVSASQTHICVPIIVLVNQMVVILLETFALLRTTQTNSA